MGLGAKVKNALSGDHHSSTRTADHNPGTFHNDTSSVPRTTTTKDYGATSKATSDSTSPTDNYTHSGNTTMSDLGHDYYRTTNSGGRHTKNSRSVDDDLRGYRAEEYDSPGALSAANNTKTSGQTPYWGNMNNTADTTGKDLPLRPKDQGVYDGGHQTAATGTTALTGSHDGLGKNTTTGHHHLHHSNNTVNPAVAAAQGTALANHLETLPNYGVQEGRAHEAVPGQHHAARHQGNHVSDSTHAATTGAGIIHGGHQQQQNGIMTPPKTASPTGGVGARNDFGPGHRGAKVMHSCSRCGADEDISRYFEGDSVYRLA